MRCYEGLTMSTGHRIIEDSAMDVVPTRDQIGRRWGVSRGPHQSFRRLRGCLFRPMGVVFGVVGVLDSSQHG